MLCEYNITVNLGYLAENDDKSDSLRIAKTGSNSVPQTWQDCKLYH